MEISDFEQVKAWLEDQEPETAICFAAWNALRRLPYLGDASHLVLNNHALNVLRALLVTTVYARFSDTNLSNESVAATRAAYASQDALVFVGEAQEGSKAHDAVRSAEEASRAVTAFLCGPEGLPEWGSHGSVQTLARFSLVGFPDPTTEMLSFKEVIYKNGALNLTAIFDQMLWPQPELPLDLHRCLQKLNAFLSMDLAVWGFWKRWYEGFLGGNPVNWEVQLAIAMLPNKDWDKGPEWIAEKIRRIERNARTSVAPPLILDQEQRVFVIADEDTLPSEVMVFARERIAMALQNALSASSGNGLHDGSYETIAIRLALERHPGNASLLATAFYDASLSFASNIGASYPEDTSLINLKNALYATAEEICELSPDARKRCARLASLAVSESAVIPDQPDVLELANIVTEETDEEAREVIQTDAREIAAGGVIPKWLRARFTNYVTTIAIWIDRTKKGHERLSWLVKAVDQLLDWFKSEDS